MRSLLCGLLLLSGCWSPLLFVDDDLLPVNRGPAGAAGGGAAMTAGGTAMMGGGSAMGGGRATRDGGVPFDATPVLAPVSGPLPASCTSDRDPINAALRGGIPLDAGCGNTCLYAVTETSLQLVWRSGLGPSAEVLWFPVEGGLGPDFVVFTSYRTDTPRRRLVAKALRSDTLFELQPVGNGNVSVSGVWFQGAFHYVVTESAAVANARRTSTLRVWSPERVGGSQVVAALPTPLTAGFGINSLTASAYLLALEDGLYRVPLFGVNQVATRVVAVRDVTALTVTDTGPFAYATRSEAGSRSIVSGDFGATVQTRVLTTELGAKTLGVLDFDRLVSLDDDGVWVLDRQGVATPTLLYGQRDALQGHRMVSGLVVEPFNGSRVWVGEICRFDADAPGFGTVKLELPSRPGAVPSRPGAATWVTGTPEWPWRTPVLDSSWERQQRDGLFGAFLVSVTAS